MLLVYVLAGAVVPLLITPGLLFHYDTAPKVILLALIAALALSRFRQFPSDIRALWSRTPGRWLIVMTAAQLVWLAIATAASSRPWFSLFGSGWRRFGLIEVASLLAAGLAIAGGLTSNPSRIRTLLRIIVVAGFLASIYGIFEYFGIDPFQPAAAYQAHAGDSVIVRPPGTMGHADYFGWWLAIEFFCAIACARIETAPWKYVDQVAAVFIVAATIMSGTRAAILAIIAGVLGMLLMSPIRATRKHLVAAGIATVVFIAFAVSPAGTLLRARAVWSGDEPVGGARPLLWRDSLRMAAGRPLTGFGPETFLTAFAPYQSEDLSRQFPDFHHESPHNLGLDALTSTGLPGLLLMLGWGLMAWRAAVSALRHSSSLAAPLGGALIASATAAMFSAASPGPVLLSMVVTGILIAVGPPAAPDPKKATDVSRVPGRLAWGALSALAVLGLLAFGGVLSVYEFRLQRFSLYPAESSYKAVLAASLPGAADDLYASRKLQLECQKHTDLGGYVICIQQTLRAAARALRTDDDLANAWYNLAMLNAAQNNVPGTRQGLEQAIQASPNWFKPHWTLAQLLVRTGNKERAALEAARGAFLDSNRDPEVTETLKLAAHRVE
jgi:O-antigen ligase